MMAHFAVRLEAPVSAREAWERVLDLQAQEEIIPFTTVRRLPATSAAGELQVGTRFVGRTAWGPIGFEDPMVVEAIRAPSPGPFPAAPGFVRIRKEGNVIGGWIDLVVVAERGRPPGGPRSRVTWSQVISVRWVPRALDPVVAAFARAAYGWALRRLLARE